MTESLSQKDNKSEKVLEMGAKALRDRASRGEALRRFLGKSKKKKGKSKKKKG